MNDLDNAFIETALQKMVSQGYFDICTIDNILKVTGGVCGSELHDRLRLLHCVHFNKMPQPLLDALPGLIREALNSPKFNIDDLFRKPAAKAGNVIDITPERKSGLLRYFK